jgi:hypothetical protein
MRIQSVRRNVTGFCPVEAASCDRGLMLRILLTVFLLVTLGAGTALAQSQLVPLVTDKTPMVLSNRFGVWYSDAINDVGDYAFGYGTPTAVFLRRAGDTAPALVFQSGDEVPGRPGSRVAGGGAVVLNAAGVLVFHVEFMEAPSLLWQGAIIKWDGASLTTLVTGLDTDPVSGKTYGRFSSGGLNDRGDVAFTAPLVQAPVAVGVPGNPTLFIIPAGGAPVRIVGLGDQAPGTNGGTFAGRLSFGRLNNRGEKLLTGTITMPDGSSRSGLFVASIADGVRKIVVPGDQIPGSAGMFSGVTGGTLNNEGQVVFTANNAIWLYRPDAAPGEEIVQLVGAGVKPSLGCTFSNVYSGIVNDAGTLVFTANVTGTTTNNGTGVFRRLPDSKLQGVAWRNQSAPGATGQTFSGTWSSLSINASGTVGFYAYLSGGPVYAGIYRQSGTALPESVVLDTLDTAPIGGKYSLRGPGYPVLLGNGAVKFAVDLVDGGADFGSFLATGTDTKVLMSTADELPTAAAATMFPYETAGSGKYVGFTAQRAGGGVSLLVHDIAAQTTSVVATDGDVPSGIGRLRIGSVNAVYVNAKGHVAFPGNVMEGAGAPRRAIFLWQNGTLAPIVAIGDTLPESTRTFASLSLQSVMPSPLNDADQILFYGAAAGSSAPAGLFLGSTSGVRKVALNGESAPGGQPFYNLSASAATVNHDGQVAFRGGNTSGSFGQGIYLFTPDASPEVTKICEVGDAGPNGTIVAGFGYPALNNAGQLAFFAQLTGGIGGKRGVVFLASNSGGTWTLIPLAVDGADATAAGPGYKYSIARGWWDLALNDRDDVVFRSDLSGGSADSGYFFARRNAQGQFETKKVALADDDAPGATAGKFLTMVPSLTNVPGEFVQMDGEGNVAFQTFYYDDDGWGIFGCWHAKPNGTMTIEQLLVRGGIAPAFGGGTAIITRYSISWNSEGRYPVFALITGGTFRDGIFLFVQPEPTTTPAGSAVFVQPTDATTGQEAAASVTFGEVTTAGETTLTTSAAGPTVPSAFSLGEVPTFYNLTTTAVVAGPIEVCVTFNLDRFPDTSGLRLLHYEGGVWRDVTTGGGAVGNTICGQVTSLSPFTVVQDVAPPELDVSVTPSVIWPPNNRLVRVTATTQANDPGDPAPGITLMSITSNEPVEPDDIQAAIGTDCRSFKLRATRLGSGTGRTYTITYRATDVSGLFTEKVVTVLVPHDQRK